MDAAGSKVGSVAARKPGFVSSHRSFDEAL